MAGEFKVNGVSFATESGGTLTVNNSKVRLPSSGNGIEDSSGNSVLSESGGNVSLTAKNATVTGDFIPSNSFMFRNKLINGNFDIWQRGTSQTNSGFGSADRWHNEHNGSSKTASQQSFANGQTDVPGNPKFYLRNVVTSSANAANYVIVYQNIEGVETLAGKTVTLSFYAKADSSKNIATEFAQSFGTGGSPSSFNPEINVTTHSLTSSWQKFTVTTTLPSISGKTIGSDNNDILGVNFWLEAGANFNTRTNSLGQQSGTFDIAQVQIEEGSSATPFEHRPIGMELSLCQRYCQKLRRFEMCKMRESDRYSIGTYQFVTEMRAAPTIPARTQEPDNLSVSVGEIDTLGFTCSLTRPGDGYGGTVSSGGVASAEL
mgnify:CR=1 FL=1